MTCSDHNTILVVDDDPHVLTALKILFEDDYEVFTAASGSEAIELSRQHKHVAVVVMDIKMEGMDGICAGRSISETRPDVPVIFHTGYSDKYDEVSLDSSDHPFDFITKGNSSQRLIRSVRNAVESWKLKQNLSSLAQIGASQFNMIGRSRPMLEVFQHILKVAPLDTKVMILGETGTGKELVAKALHTLSPRVCGKWAVFNCHHKNPELVEAELFGYVKGAFTDAKDNHVGLFEYADGGTMFLDEIGDLDITTQGKLLRVLESGEYQPIGSPELRHTDIRLLCATHRNLEELVKQKLFREDLYYRLRGVEIKLPPLRDHREDIPLLAEYYKDRETIGKDMPPKYFDPAALEILLNYDWPGNVRELEDAVKSVILLTDSHLILASDIAYQLKLDKNLVPNRDENRFLSRRVREFRRNCIIEALHQTRNNISKTATILGVDRSNLAKEIHLLDIPLD